MMFSNYGIIPEFVTRKNCRNELQFSHRSLCSMFSVVMYQQKIIPSVCRLFAISGCFNCEKFEKMFICLKCSPWTCEIQLLQPCRKHFCSILENVSLKFRKTNEFSQFFFSKTRLWTHLEISFQNTSQKRFGSEYEKIKNFPKSSKKVLWLKLSVWTQRNIYF